MKKQALLLVAAGMLLAACGGTNSSESSTSTSTSTSSTSTSSSSETSTTPVDPKAPLAAFFEGLTVQKGFVMIDDGWRILYGYGEDALYSEYDSGGAYGLLSHPTEGILGFEFDANNRVAPNEVIDAEYEYGTSVYAYDYTPMDIMEVTTLEDWTVDAEGTFTTTNENMILITDLLASYQGMAADLITSVTLDVEADGSAATLYALIEDEEEPAEINLDITVGSITDPSIEEWRADPWGMPEDDGRIELFLDNLATFKNFTMVDAGWATLYGYGEDAFYMAYEGENSAYNFGILKHPTEGFFDFSFDETGKVVVEDAEPAEYGETSVYDFTYTPMDLTLWDAADYTVAGVGTYVIDDEMACLLAAYLTKYGSNILDYVTGLGLVIDEDGMGATIVVLNSAGVQINLAVTIGTAQNEGIDAWRADPYGPEPAPESID